MIKYVVGRTNSTCIDFSCCFFFSLSKYILYLKYASYIYWRLHIYHIVSMHSRSVWTTHWKGQLLQNLVFSSTTPRTSYYIFTNTWLLNMYLKPSQNLWGSKKKKQSMWHGSYSWDSNLEKEMKLICLTRILHKCYIYLFLQTLI